MKYLDAQAAKAHMLSGKKLNLDDFAASRLHPQLPAASIGDGSLGFAAELELSTAKAVPADATPTARCGSAASLGRKSGHSARVCTGRDWVDGTWFGAVI